jgi:hypothetical protein
MVFDVVDSARGTYSGTTILPNGARAPHLETTVTKGEMQWKQQNSGGGFWLYTGRLVTQDSVAGTAVPSRVAAASRGPEATRRHVRHRASRTGRLSACRFSMT